MNDNLDNINHYYKIMKFPTLEKIIQNLIGIIEGIQIDGKINASEKRYLDQWLIENEKITSHHLGAELYKITTDAIRDEILTSEERESIKFSSELVLNVRNYYNESTSNIQVFHGILGGISSDGIVSTEEVEKLRKWINNNYHLKGSYPFDEVESIAYHAMKDGVIDESESRLLFSYFSQFQKILGHSAIDSKELTLNGICSMNPEVIFQNNLFCFTGLSVKAKRVDVEEIIINNGGLYHDSIVKDTKYLIIGADGNPCWAFSCYGRKVEKAVQIRKSGGSIIIINEHDFWDVVGNP